MMKVTVFQRGKRNHSPCAQMILGKGVGLVPTLNKPLREGGIILLPNCTTNQVPVERGGDKCLQRSL